jgi:hypothetical protein
MLRYLRVGELIMARRDFGGDAKTRPVVQLNFSVRRTQSGEIEAGCVSKRELNSAARKFRSSREFEYDRLAVFLAWAIFHCSRILLQNKQEL